MLESSPVVAYVGGYGRSGSTLLAQLLGSAPSVLALGEMSALFTCLADNAWRCSCGANVRECPFWTGVLVDAFGRLPDPGRARQLARLQQRVESWRGLLAGPPRINEEYVGVQRRLFEALTSRLPGGSGVLLDSSKTVYNTVRRPLHIARATNYEVRILHLTRDPRGVWWSLARRGRNRAIEEGRTEPQGAPFATTRTISGWAIANLAAQHNGLKDGSYVRLRYEDLIAKPFDSLGRMSSFLGIALDNAAAIVSHGRTLPECHQIAGNRRRFQGSISLRPDDVWKRRIPGHIDRIIKWTLLPLMAQYQYH